MRRGMVWLTVAIFLAANSPAHAMARKPKIFPIEIKVDFGPAEKPTHVETLDIEQGTTPKDAVAQVFPVLLGKSCCSLHEVLAIDGVKVEPAKNRWWICLLNRSRNVSPYRTKLKPGDRLEWRYIEEVHGR